MATKKAHIVKRDGKWALQAEGSSKPKKTFHLKQEAIADGRKLVTKGHVLIIHDATGKIQKWERPPSTSSTVKPKPSEIYHKRAAGSSVKRVTQTEIRKLGPVLNQLAEYDKKGRKR